MSNPSQGAVALEIDQRADRDPLLMKEGKEISGSAKVKRSTIYPVTLGLLIIVVILLPLIISLSIAAERRERKRRAYPSITGEMRALYEGLPAAPGMYAVDSNQYVFTSSPANCPFILSVTHGGLYYLTGVPTRTTGAKEGDDRTMLLGVTVFDEIQRLTKGHCVPCIVALNVQRQWAEVNKGPPFYDRSQAWESETGEKIWNQFQDQFSRCIDLIKDQGRLPFVVDIHGNSNPLYFNTVVPGTGDRRGQTLPSLNKTGRSVYPEAFADDDSLFGLMAEEGLPVFNITSPAPIPENGTAPVVDPGFIARQMALYYQVDAIQLEFSITFRRTTELAMDAGRKLAAALVDFAAEGWPPHYDGDGHDDDEHDEDEDDD